MCYVYIVECRDGSLYTGWTSDIKKRVQTHNAGMASKYTRTRLPVTLRYYERFNTRSGAMKRECAVKKMSRGEKLRLIARKKSRLQLER